MILVWYVHVINNTSTWHKIKNQHQPESIIGRGKGNRESKDKISKSANTSIRNSPSPAFNNKNNGNNDNKSVSPTKSNNKKALSSSSADGMHTYLYKI